MTEQVEQSLRTWANDWLKADLVQARQALLVLNELRRLREQLTRWQSATGKTLQQVETAAEIERQHGIR